MTEGLASISARLRQLEDREAIRALIANYGPLADSGEAQVLSKLWLQDGTYGVGGMGNVVGRADIAGLIEGPVHQSLMEAGCAHLLGPVAIDLDGDRAIARGHSVVLRHSEQGFEVYRVSANRWELLRCDGLWQVSHRENALLDGAEAARALLSPPTGPRR